MGALAGLLRARGHEVRGSDEALYPPMSDQLEAQNIPVFRNFAGANLAWKPDVVVVGNVCTKDHVEVQEARQLGLPMKSLPETLGAEFLANKHSVVVAGSHGKTTTSSLIAQILISAGRDPSCFIGGVPTAMGRGWRYGNSDEFIVEGDEYDSAFFDKESKFLHYRPRSVVLTSVELDHVDMFSSLEQVRAAFRKFIGLIPEDGLLVVCASSRNAMAIAESEARCKVETYAATAADPAASDDKRADATWQAKSIEYHESGRCRFELWRGGELFDRYESILVGQHNVANIVAAIAIASSLGIGRADIRAGVSLFAGVKRRQEIRGVAQGVNVIDDYAHHPTAVGETLAALRKRFPGRRVIAIFEPRTATSRRTTFQREYVDAFLHADVVVIGSPYKPEAIPEDQRLDPGQLALDIHQRGVQAIHIADVSAIVAHTKELARPGDVVAVLSSGSFDGIHDKLLTALGDRVMPAARPDMAAVRKLLHDTDLGADSAKEEDFLQFHVLRNESGLVGCVALEFFGEDAVLRSLVVEPDSRGVGYGWMLADTVIAFARRRGVQRIYLLTETASDFFAAKHGFRVVDPSTISNDIASSSTFQNRAESAVAMRLDL